MTKTGAAARPTPTDEGETIVEWVITHQRALIIGAIVVAVGAGGGWLWQRSAQIKESRAAEAYQTAESSFMSGNLPLAQTELEKITTRWSGTAAGSQAASLLAQIHFDQGRFAEGIAVLESAVTSAPKELRAGMLALLAGGHEGAGKPAEAAAAFARAADVAQFQLDRQQYRMERARTLRASGDTAGATAIYTDISQIEDSPFAGEAKVRLGEIRASK